MSDASGAPRVLGIDPGRGKCGLAVVARGVSEPLARLIVPRAEILPAASELIARHAPYAIALGGGTEGRAIRAEARALGLPVHVVDEHGTTLAARERYFAAHPPRGWRRLIPAGLRLPPGPIDDWAATLIAERFLAEGPPV